MRSPLSSRTNSRPERVTPDEFFDLVVFSVVMVFPSVPQLPSRNLPTLALFDAYGRSSRVKHRVWRRISAKEKATRVGRMSQDQWTAGICQPLEYDFLRRAERGPRIQPGRRRSLTDGAAFAERRVLGR